MASSFARNSFRCFGSRPSVSLPKTTVQYGRMEHNLPATFASLSRLSASRNSSLMGHNFNRSIWYLVPSSSRSFNRNSLHHSNPSVTCSCGGFHSESDKAFSALLCEELKLEKANMIKLPTMSGNWNVQVDGADCKLTSQVDGDSITVELNVNASVPPLESEDSDEDAAVISKPDFSVQIKKPAANDLVTFDCYFPDDPPDTDQEEDLNSFSIRSVIVHKGEVTESTYEIDTENIDPTLYRSLLTYLDDRGVGSEFGEELIDLSTVLENHQYVQALEKLQHFVDCK